MKKTKNLFPENNEAKRRLNKNIEKNLTTQEICSTLIPKKFQNKISENLKNTTNMTSLRRMLTTIDNTTEHSSLARIKEFKQQFKTINVFLNEYINNTSNEDDVTNPINKIKDPLIKQYIENIKKTLNNENYSEENYIQRENNMCKFFSIFSTEQSGNFWNLLNINSLESFTKHLNNGQTLNETDLGCFSTNFQEEHTQILAEENFDTSLKEMS